jgi:hypothetical protein
MESNADVPCVVIVLNSNRKLAVYYGGFAALSDDARTMPSTSAVVAQEGSGCTNYYLQFFESLEKCTYQYRTYSTSFKSGISSM